MLCLVHCRATEVSQRGLEETVNQSMAASGERRAGSVQGAFLALLSIFSVAAALLISPILPRMTEHFAGLPNAQGLVILSLTIPALVVAITSPFIGRLIDGLSRKWVLVVSLLVYGLCGLAPFVLDDLGQIIISRAGVGIAEAGVMTASTTLLGDYFRDKDRERWLVAQTAMASISAIVFIAVGGALGDMNWRFPFLIYSIAILAVPFCLAFIYEPQVAPHDLPTIGFGFPWRKVGQLYLIAVFAAIMFFIVPIQLPFLLTGRGIASPQVIGLTSAAGSVAVPVGAWVFSRTSHWSLSANLALAFLLIAGGFVLFVGNGDFWVTFAGVVIASLGCGIVLPALLTTIMSRLPYDRRGQGTGFWQSSFFLGNFLSPVIVLGLSAGAGSLGNAVLVLAAFVAAAFVVFAIASRGRGPAAVSQAA